ncbi:MAG: glycoside hydrolase family 3 N-terminal domain-containing protein [Chloroflexota bacterium]|nr:glycoside hydrolase family 3 N-terminal domain-containing protein [Chloroflexota bacterium]
MTLTLEEAIGQKLMLAFEGTEPTAGILETIGTGHIGGLTLFRPLNVEGPAQVRRLTAALQEAATRAGQPPLLIATDQEGGQLMAIAGTTPFPGNMALGATGSVDLARRTGQALGLELAAMGVNVNYAPVCDVNVNPRNPNVGTRSFGENPAAVARFCAAMVEGLQSSGIAATAKHFPGHGDAGSDPHYELPVVPHDRGRLARTAFPPFEAAVEAGTRLVMTTHVAFPSLSDGLALPSTLSRTLLGGLLRREMGFRGVIISDAMDMAAIEQGSGFIVDVLAAVAAGVDLLLLLDNPAAHEAVTSALTQATRRRLLSPRRVRASAERVLALKRWVADVRQPALDVVGCPEHRDLAFETAARSITLVRDEASLLPLRLSSEARVGVVVPGSVDLTPADTSSYVSCDLAEAVRRYAPSAHEFVVPHAPADADIASLRHQAGEYDVLIVGTTDAAGEPWQAALVEALEGTGVPMVTVGLRLPYDLQAYPTASTYLCTYTILAPSMDALAGALWGKIPLRGRLPVSIPGLYEPGHGVLTE